MRSLFIAPLVAATLAMPLTAQTTISTSGTNHFTSIGMGSGAGDVPTTAVQSFILPSGMNFLQSFSFYYNEAFGGTDLNLNGSVYTLNTTTSSLGTLLYSSPFFVASHDNANDVAATFGTGQQPLNLNLGAVPLGPNEVFALVLSSIGGATDPVTGAQIAVATTSQGDPKMFPGGFFISVASNASELSDSGSLLSFDENPDAAFSASFTATATPEPASLALLATGLAGLGGVAARRRSRRVRG